MAEVNPKLLDVWISDTMWPDSGPPKSGNTGTLEPWVSDTIWLDVYAEAETTGPPPVAITNKFMHYQRMRK
jgi:hypothetical protein